MTGFYFAFLAVLLAGLGARDQVTVAGMAARQGQRPALLIVALFVSLATAAFAAWGAAAIAPMLVPKARLIMAAVALGLAGLEALSPFALRRPEEPTASLGALAIVLLAHQLTDAARFLIFAVAAAQAAPLSAGVGGAAGAAVSLTAAWALPAVLLDPRLRLVRRGVGALLLLVAFIVGYRALTL